MYKRFIEPLAIVIGITIIACSIAIAEPQSEKSATPQLKLPPGWAAATPPPASAPPPSPASPGRSRAADQRR